MPPAKDPADNRPASTPIQHEQEPVEHHQGAPEHTASASKTEHTKAPSKEDLWGDLERLDQQAKDQGHSLTAVLAHAAQAAFGITLV